jgi:hypothetical protein
MINGIQKKLKMLGDSGCYWLCILKACGVDSSRLISLYDYCVAMKWMDSDCFIKQPEAIVGFLLSKKVICYKSNNEEKDALFNIARFYNDRTKLSHFVLLTDNGIWDPLGDSRTVAEGHIADYRIFK